MIVWSFTYFKMYLFLCIFMSVFLGFVNGFTVKGPSGPLVVPLGGSVLLPCSVDSVLSLEDLEVQWKRSDTEILIHLYQDGDIRPEVQNENIFGRAHFFTDNIKDGNFSLMLVNVTAEDEGEYTCTVHSGHESHETAMEIKCGGGVSERLKVTCSSQSIFAFEGEDVTLSCSVDSHIPPEDIDEVSWKKTYKKEHIVVLLYEKGEALPEASHEQYRDRVEFVTEEIHRGNFSLKLKRVRTEDAGVYMCQVFAGQLSHNTTIALRLGLSGLHIMVLILCISACGSALLFCSLIYCGSNSKDTSRTVKALKVSLVICPNICMFIALIIWGVTEGFLQETITCCAIYILRPAMLFWAVPYLNYLQDITKSWIRFSTIAREFAILTVIVYTVLFIDALGPVIRTYGIWTIAFFICFGILLVCCLSMFTGGCCGNNKTKIPILGFLAMVQVGVLVFSFRTQNPDFMYMPCVVFLAVLLILVVYEDKGHVHLHNVIVFIFGSVGIILLNSLTLAAELILKRRNGERAVGDFRLIVFPSECAVVLCWLFFSTYACCCATKCVCNKRTQRPRNTPESHEMECFTASAS